MNIHQFIIAQGQTSIGGLIMPIIFIIILWVLMIRPQQKRAKALRERQASLKKGDDIVTIGGMHATVNSVSDTTVSLKISDGIYVKYDKTAIATILDKESKS